MKKNILFILTCIIFIFLYVVYFLNFIQYENLENKNDIELFISRYNEDLEWLKNEPFNKYPVTIYNKGIDENFYKPPLLKEVIRLENVGVCVHSYFYFIIQNYEKLPKITVFLPGSCMDEHKKEKTLNTMKQTEETKNSVFYCSYYENGLLNKLYDFKIDENPLANAKNRDINVESKLVNSEIRPFGKWYEKKFPNINNINHSNYHGIFSVSNTHILNRSKESYNELMQCVNKNKNEESAHYFERSFLAVFNPIPLNCIYPSSDNF